jgi:uncharacterized protein YkwD
MSAGLVSLTAWLLGATVQAPAPAAALPAAMKESDVAVWEAKATAQVVAEFKAAKLAVPMRDPAASLAARSLAQRILDGSLKSSDLAQATPQALSEQGGWDPALRTLLLSGTSVDTLVNFVKGQASLTEEPADVMGLGLASNASKSVMLVLVGKRYADLQAFPRKVPVGGSGRLQVQLWPGLEKPTLVVTAPDGKAATQEAVHVARGELTADLRFAQQGRYTVEVMARSAEGPRVAALFQVVAGVEAPAVVVEDPEEPADPMSKVLAVLDHINKLRAKAKVPPLEHDLSLDLVALDHSEDMARNHYFAHVSPTQGDLHQRLNGRYGYLRAGENLGEAGGALAAERAIEASPAHRENLLDPGFTHVGLALYPNLHSGGSVTLLLTEIFASPTEKLADPGSAIYAALNGQRTRAKQPPLGRDPDLDKLAARQLAVALQAGTPPKSMRSLEDAVLENTDVEGVAADFVIGAVPTDLVKSKNLSNRSFNRVGVAAQAFSSPQYGTDRLWMCVVYAQVSGTR